MYITCFSYYYICILRVSHIITHVYYLFLILLHMYITCFSYYYICILLVSHIITYVYYVFLILLHMYITCFSYYYICILRVSHIITYVYYMFLILLHMYITCFSYYYICNYVFLILLHMYITCFSYYYICILRVSHIITYVYYLFLILLHMYITCFSYHYISCCNEEFQVHCHLALTILFITTLCYFYFPGNAHLVYAIIRKRNVFHQLANLPTDPTGIKKPGKQSGKVGKDLVDEETYVDYYLFL